MKFEHEGRGEGFGRYKGLTVVEIQALFDRCIEDPNFRSLSAVLRITREQLDARGNLGIYPWFALIAGLCCAGSLIGRKFLTGQYLEWATKTAIGAGCAFGLLLLSTVPTWGARRRNVAQEKAICQSAVDALVRILEHKPALKPLTVEQDFTVRFLMKKTSGSQALRDLL